LRAEDLIVELGGSSVERVDDIQRSMGQEAIGRPLSVTALRGDKWLDLELSPVELSE
jgi:S1-C subfamily serine protease